MLVEIRVNRELAACRNLMQAASVELGVGDQAFDAGDPGHKPDEGAGINRIEIKLGRRAEPRVWPGAEFALIACIIALPIAPFEGVEFGIDELKQCWGKQAFEDKMWKGLVIRKGLVQFPHSFLVHVILIDQIIKI